MANVHNMKLWVVALTYPVVFIYCYNHVWWRSFSWRYWSLSQPWASSSLVLHNHEGKWEHIVKLKNKIGTQNICPATQARVKLQHITLTGSWNDDSFLLCFLVIKRSLPGSQRTQMTVMYTALKGHSYPLLEFEILAESKSIECYPHQWQNFSAIHQWWKGEWLP